MARIELIVTDLDGTFTTSKYAFCPENAQAVRMAQARGIRVCACTARNWALAKGQVRRAGFDSFTIACNGASLVDNQTGLPVWRLRIAAEDVEALVRTGVRHGARVAVYTNEQILFLDGHAADHYASYPADWHRVDRDLAIPVTRCHSETEMAVLGGEAAELVEFIKPNAAWDAQAQALFARFSSSGLGGACTFIMQSGATKRLGAMALAKRLGIPRERVMAVGDNQNDAEMLRWAGVGVAMGDGDGAAKDAADMVTDAHDNAGFYKAVLSVALQDRL
jgi:Cof subfamily protein (haloacid dehalogenase superfamily)